MASFVQFYHREQMQTETESQWEKEEAGVEIGQACWGPSRSLDCSAIARIV